jgi:hypothetical protein
MKVPLSTNFASTMMRFFGFAVGVGVEAEGEAEAEGEGTTSVEELEMEAMLISSPVFIFVCFLSKLCQNLITQIFYKKEMRKENSSIYDCRRI